MASSWLEEDTLCPEGQYLLENNPIFNVGGAGECEGEEADAGKDDDDGRDDDHGGRAGEDAYPDDADGAGMAVSKLGQHSQTHALTEPPQHQEVHGIREQHQQGLPPHMQTPPRMAPQQIHNEAHALEAPSDGGHTQQLPAQPLDEEDEFAPDSDSNFFGEDDDEGDIFESESSF